MTDHVMDDVRDTGILSLGWARLVPRAEAK